MKVLRNETVDGGMAGFRKPFQKSYVTLGLRIGVSLCFRFEKSLLGGWVPILSIEGFCGRFSEILFELRIERK